MLTNKFRKMLNCEEVRCISDADLKRCETKFNAKHLKNDLQLAAINYDGRYDSKDHVYGNNNKEKLDTLIQETMKGGIICSI